MYLHTRTVCMTVGGVFSPVRAVKSQTFHFKFKDLILTFLLPAKGFLQAINGLTGGLQDTLSVPDPNLPGTSVKTDGTDGKQLAITSPRYPWPASIPGCSWLHFLRMQKILNSTPFLTHLLRGRKCLISNLDLPLCCLFPRRTMELSFLLSPTHRDELSCNVKIYNSWRLILNYFEKPL